MRVSELMSPSTVTIFPEDTVACAARLMERHGIGVLPVCSPQGKLKGIVTDRDIATRCVAADLAAEQTPVREIMSRHVATVPPQADVREAALHMAQCRIRRLPVAEGGRVLGMVSIGDLMRTHAIWKRPRRWPRSPGRGKAPIKRERKAKGAINF